MIILRQPCDSVILDRIINNEPEAKTESKGVTKIASSNHPIEKMSLHKARIARRQGQFIKVAGRADLYQDAKTNDLWKITDDKSAVERLFDEKNGTISA
ncbi:MAG: hypothetical protein Q7R33_03570 [Nitrosarchaeum sp.]|nr:hypothetical protein [Nitrosarchaeum sp.]